MIWVGILIGIAVTLIVEAGFALGLFIRFLMTDPKDLP